MEKNKIIIAKWDPRNHKSSGKSLFVGRHRGTEKGPLGPISKIYGISLEFIDPSKDCQLHGYSLDKRNIQGEFTEVTKEEVRSTFIALLDQSLDHLFSDQSSKEAQDYEVYVKQLFSGKASMKVSQ